LNEFLLEKEEDSSVEKLLQPRLRINSKEVPHSQENLIQEETSDNKESTTNINNETVQIQKLNPINEDNDNDDKEKDKDKDKEIDQELPKTEINNESIENK